MDFNQMDEKQFEKVAARVLKEASYILSLSERFQWFVSQLRDRRYAYEVDELKHYLYSKVTVPAQRERILALLSIHPHPDARLVIEAYEPPANNYELGKFKAFALNQRDITDRELICAESLFFCNLAPAWTCKPARKNDRMFDPDLHG